MSRSSAAYRYRRRIRSVAGILNSTLSNNLVIQREAMRYLHFILMAFMILFMAVQYNDPDGLLWIAIYGVPAGWCAVATFWRQCLAGPMAAVSLLLSLTGSFALMVYYWPSTPQFWKQEVWWETETAREGMGMMIVTVVLLVVAADFLWHRKKSTKLQNIMNEPAIPPAVPTQNH